MSRTPERPRRREALDVLGAAEQPLGVADVAARLGVHVNTARFHLDSLVAEGVVQRRLEPPAGRGRPRAVYARRPGMDRGGTRDYRMLARILLGQLSESGSGAGEKAEEAGRAWGRYLVDRPAPFQQLTGQDATARLTALLEELGFAPGPGEATGEGELIRLRHCPFLELAEEFRPLVCRIHLGLMRGALAELGAPVAAADLEPFAEVDACLTRLEFPGSTQHKAEGQDP